MSVTFPIGEDMDEAATFYHVGVVVPDLAAGMAEMSAAVGLAWRPPAQMEMTVRTPSGLATVNFHYAYSLDGPPYVELVESVDGSIWAAHDTYGGHAHHLGYWSADLQADAARLERAGMVREVSDAAADGGFEVFTYHRAKSGPLIEYVSTSMKAQLLA